MSLKLSFFFFFIAFPSSSTEESVFSSWLNFVYLFLLWNRLQWQDGIFTADMTNSADLSHDL